MFQDHYPPLFFAYLIGLGGWLPASRLLPPAWPRGPVEAFERPWKEFGIAMVGALGILGMGQLWSEGIRLPEDGAPGPLLGSINQILIFSPILLVVVILVLQRSRDIVWFWCIHYCLDMTQFAGINGVG